jgi:hypothetical protein
MLFAHPPIAEHLLALVLKFDSLVLVIACSAASASVPASGFKDICSCGLKFDSLVLVIACSIHLKKKRLHTLIRRHRLQRQHTLVA